MDLFSALFLSLDGITNGAVYALLGLSLVLVFTTTRVVNVAQGEYVTFGALSFASFTEGTLAPILYVVAAGGIASLMLDLRRAVLLKRSLWSTAARYLGAAAVLGALAFIARSSGLMVVQLVAALLLVASLGPIIYRLTVEPNPGNSPVVLLICTVGVSMVLHPLGLLLWGADPRTVAPISAARVEIGGVDIAMQSVFILIAAILATGALFVFFRFTLFGKALRAASVNRDGAQYCGVPVGMVGRLSYFIAAALSGLSGTLLAPLVTANYEMGFVVGLKGFVGAAMGGLVNYPLSLAGVFVVGLFESFSAFLSSAFRDAWVFSLVIPILLRRNSKQGEDLDD
jgi:branched-chain amino acid transport system permease protein